VLGLTRALALELAPHVRCNAICPGGIDTPMSRTLLAQFEEGEQAALREKLIGRQLLKRFAEAHEIARSIIFLLSDESAFVTGAVLAADGGATAW
jgi:NAD(P)-dependent dehydrogenase (short-subunit alcohol dehydrogenase family)